MLIYLREVIFAAVKTVLRSIISMILYTFLSRIFTRWFDLHIGISYFCSMYCISKIVAYFTRMWYTMRIKYKKSDDIIILNELSLESPSTLITKINDDKDKFDNDWKFLLDDDEKNMFSSIVNIPFHNGRLFLVIFIIFEYQMNNYEDNYFISLSRIITFFLVLICGSSIRYHTLYQRDQNKFLEFMLKKREETERLIVYSKNTIPIASISLQVFNTPDNVVCMIQLYEINSKFSDYFSDISNYICQGMIESIKTTANEHKKTANLIWSVPTCKRNWTYTLKTNQFILRHSYKDFSFMPLIHSYVEQYEYIYQYKDLSTTEVLDEKNKDQ